jgi:AbrB family looped-hinge helix DNA binding protein
MRTTIDQAGRIVIPKPLREQVGMVAGEVEVVVDGNGVRIEPVLTEDRLEWKGNRLVVPATGSKVDDEMIRALRDAIRR